MAASSDQVGRAMSRAEGYDKVTGRARYIADLPLPDLVHGVLVQSEVPHGSVRPDSIRTSAEGASAAPGVVHVLTPLNCPPLRVLPRELTFDFPLERRPPLSDLIVQHVGQHMAMVVADTLENATHAASLLDLAYEPVQALLDARDVLDHPAAPDEKDGQIRHGSYLPDHFVKLDEEKLQDQRGSSGEPNLAYRVSARCTTQINAHYPIELASTIASRDGDALTVHDSTRWITGERKALAAYLGMPEDKIRVLSPLVGGAFGSKSFLWMHVVLCAVAAREVQRPVKVVLTRDQVFSSTGHRPRTEQDLILVADEDGQKGIANHRHGRFGRLSGCRRVETTAAGAGYRRTRITFLRSRFRQPGHRGRQRPVRRCAAAVGAGDAAAPAGW
jgi:xanthine dehydrogenase YagR molybdenum-binding subunit